MVASTSSVTHHFQTNILNWFADHQRDYPWRRTRDPYKVLIAEFMLQRTGATQTIPVYESFTLHYPTFRKLRSASEPELAMLLRPLGRTGRSQQLRRAIETIVSSFKGTIPRTENRLLQIPGVGKYTARAVMVFAYGRRMGLFDPNIARILSRVFGFSSNKSRPHTDPAVWNAADSLAPSRRTKEYNWALLDLAATVCVQRNPKCNECPINSLCRYALMRTS